MDAMTKAGEQGCRVVAVDRPPFGLSQRPLQWQDGAPDSNPYTNAVRLPAAEPCQPAEASQAACLTGLGAWMALYTRGRAMTWLGWT